MLRFNFLKKARSGIACFGLSLIMLSGCSVSNDPMRSQMRGLQQGTVVDDSSYVYHLPYAPNNAYRVVQGYFSRFSHRNRAAIDFKMKRGTTIMAARGGVVTRVKADGSKGGLNKKYRSEGNYVMIVHEDGSRAGYWHLQQNGVLVNVGDTVKQGQAIGLSGKTGYALFPHLHFIVWRNSNDGKWVQTGTRFKTNKGIVYLRPFKKYRTKL